MQAQAQAQMQAQQLLLHHENSLNSSINISAKTSTRIKIFPFSCAYA